LKRRQRFRLILCWMFLFLGFQTGVWAMLLDDLVSGFHLSPGQLGMALTLQSGAGFLSLWLGGRIADKAGRKPVALLGIGGTGIFFIFLAFVERDLALLAAFIAGGIFISWYDLIANTLGGDYERNYSSRVMAHLHAEFSGGAAAGAWASGLLLARGVTYTEIYLLTGSALVLLALLFLMVPLPGKSGESREDGGDFAEENQIPGLKKGLSVILFAGTMIALCFFIDGSLEGFLSLYLRWFLQSGPLLGGIGIASLHFSAMIGRLSSSALIEKAGESRILIFSGLIASVGIAVVILTSSPVVAACGLLGVGFALSPVAPVSFSLASRANPGRGARSVSIVTGAGYLSFIVGPVLIGRVPEIGSLQTSFGLLLIWSVMILFLAVMGHAAGATKTRGTE
jgi:MFS family permease